MEIEINILASCLFPTLFSCVDIIWIAHVPVPVSIVMALTCTGAWLGITTSILRLRSTERMSVLMNLVYSNSVTQRPVN
jgi:hypothetical protein